MMKNFIATSHAKSSKSNEKSVHSLPSGEWCNGSMDVFPPTSSVPQLEAVGEICRGMCKRGLRTSNADSFGPSHFSKEDTSEDLNSRTLNYSGMCSHKNAHMSPKASGATVSMVLNKPSINGAKEGYGCSAYELQEITTISRFGSQHGLASFNAENFESQRPAETRNSDKNSKDSTTIGGAGNSRKMHYRSPTSTVFSTENGLPPNESSIKAPPFELFVSSEEGINLYVDLNSSPSDWVEGFTTEVCIFQEVKNIAVGDEKMKISSLSSKESGLQTKGDPGCPRSSLSSAVTNEHSLQDPHYSDITGETLRSCTTIPCRTPLEILGVSENDDPVLTSISRPNSDVQMQMVSGTETCVREGEMTCLDLEVLDTSQVKSASNSVLDTKLDGLNCPDSMKHQNSMFCSTCTENSARHSSGTCNVFQDRGLPVSSEICEVSVPSNTASFENPSEVCPGFSTSVSIEMQMSEVGSQCKNVINSFCQNCGLVNFDDLMRSTQLENGESANCEHDQNTCRNPPTAYTETWERSSTINDRESSECSQIDNTSERNCKRSHGNKYCDGLQSKRLQTSSVDQNGCTKPTGKNIKSSMQTAREIPSPSRRSLRLVLK
ncbi:uncharacterized protein LOC122064603 isoform X2 [Macadamia integrifolia]|uniref:uncharacterized protein LOC122064603 isoform X2 n=1 Tax=Macadamia integrifolia TaxID=60698 RepID=UPI001C4F7D82|nr:uncharacterized protein LOC122064603 isoform X2 [Macadamia integrifolia]